MVPAFFPSFFVTRRIQLPSRPKESTVVPSALANGPGAFLSTPAWQIRHSVINYLREQSLATTSLFNTRPRLLPVSVQCIQYLVFKAVLWSRFGLTLASYLAKKHEKTLQTALALIKAC